jgi:hypothetical protein
MILVSDSVTNRLFLADDNYEPKAYEVIRGKLSKQAEREIELICWGFKIEEQTDE